MCSSVSKPSDGTWGNWLESRSSPRVWMELFDFFLESLCRAQEVLEHHSLND